MQSHNIDETLLSAFIGKSYFPDVLIALESTQGGHTNINYIVYAGEAKYFLKLYRYQKLPLIEKEIDVIKQLLENKYKTPSLVKTNAGDNYATSPWGVVVITDYIEGVYPKPNDEDLFAIGSLLAELHNISPINELKQGYAIQLNDMERGIRESKMLMDRDTLSFFKSVVNIGLDIPMDLLPYGLSHCDVFLDNMIKGSNHEIYLLDFEEVAIERYLFDLGRAIIGCCLVENVIDIDQAKKLISGYSAHRELKQIEKEHLLDYIIYTGGISSFWWFYEFNVKRPDDSKKNFYVELMCPVKKLIDGYASSYQQLIA